MKDNILDGVLQLSLDIFNTNWDETQLKILDWEIQDLKKEIQEEIEENLIGKHLIFKEDYVKIYLTNLSNLHDKILSLNIKDFEFAENCDKAQEKIIHFYQEIVDFICTECLTHGIDLKKIVDNNHYTFNNIDISIFENEIAESKLKSRLSTMDSEKILKDQFSNPEYYAFFNYLVNNFDKKYSDHNKYSCIYRLMIEDEFISNDLRPERFKQILEKKPFEIEITFFLKTKNDLSKKIKMHYYELKNIFLKK